MKRLCLGAAAITTLAVGVGGASAKMTTIVDGGSGAGVLVNATAVAVAPNGDILVGDTSSGLVKRFKSDGAYLSSSGARGTGAGQFVDGPTDIAVSENGETTFVADASRIQTFSAAGQLTGSGPPNGARYVAVAPGGATVYSSDGASCQVRRMAAGLAVSATLTVDCVETGFSTLPVEIGVNQAGEVVFAGRINSLKRVSSVGATLQTFDTGTTNTAASALGLTIDRVRNETIGRTWDKTLTTLKRFSADGASRTSATGRSLADIALAADRSIYAVSGKQLLRFDERPTGALRLSQPTGTLLSGTKATLDAGASTPAFEAIARYDWDLDGNGSFETLGGTASTRDLTLVAGARTLRVRVTDIAGNEDVASLAVSVTSNTPKAVLAAPLAVLTNDLVTLDASASTAPSGAIARFEWDRDGNGKYELKTGTTPTTQVRFRLSGTRTVRVKVVSADGKTAVASRRIEVRPTPPPGTAGVSINRGAIFSRGGRVSLNLVWPRLTKSVLISNDPAFSGAKPTGVKATISWTLGAPVSNVSAVYVRFVGSSKRASYDPDPAATFSDQITVDNLAPRLRRASAIRRRGRIPLFLKAGDRISGLSKVRISRYRGGRETVKRYRKVVRLSTRARVVYVRVEDRAGNRSAWRKVVIRRR